MAQNFGIHSIKVGDVVVTVLNDGQFQAPPEWAVGIDPAGFEQALVDNFRPFPPRVTLNAFLLETGGRKILVDAGAGNKFGSAVGALASHLKTLGCAPEDIDTILLTHAHVDHIGGLTDDAGRPLYPKAELVLNTIESEFWLSDENRAQAPEGTKESFDGVRAALGAYGSRTRLIGDGDQPVPGVTARHLPGHTFGHTGYQIGSGATALLIWGDIVHLPGVQFDHPEIGMMFDADRDVTTATRLRIFDEAVDGRIMVAGMHLDFPTFGFLRRHAGRYEFEAHVWAPSA